MATYTIRFFSSYGRLVFEHVEQFMGDSDASASARKDAEALGKHAPKFEIWCGERWVPAERRAA